MDSQHFLDALLHLPGLGSAAVSPDGQRVAWSWSRVVPAADVFVAPTDGSEAPTQITSGPERTRVEGWSPDGQWVLVTEDRGGDERMRVFRVNPAAPGEMELLNEEEPNYFLRGAQLHPDGQSLFLGANVDASTGQEIDEGCIIRRNLASDELKELVRSEKPGLMGVQLNSKGTRLLYHTRDLHPSGVQVGLVSTDGSDAREVLNFGDDKKVHAAWLPDGERLIFLAEAESHRKLGSWHPEEGVCWLIDDPSRNIEMFRAPKNSRFVVFTEVREARLASFLLDPETGEERPVPNVPGNLLPLAPANAEETEWVGSYWHSRQPEDLVRFSLEHPNPENFISLTGLWSRTELKPEDLAAAEDFRWKSVDGLGIQGWLYKTRKPVKGTILLVHGGPTHHSEDALDPEIQFYVQQGFHVLDPNYRGSTGFGLAFQESIKKTYWGSLEQEDLRTGIEALIREGYAQPGKVGMTGTSYGGYSSWHCITHFPAEILAAAAPSCGMTDLVVDYYSTRPDLRTYSEEMLGGTPEEVPEIYHERSPVHFIHQIQGKVLVVQGLRDPNVTKDNLEAVRQALHDHDIDFETLEFEDEGHGIFRPSNLRILYPHLAAFFANAFGDKTSA